MPLLPAHVEWLVDNRADELAKVLAAQDVDLHVGAALAVLVDADPSPGSHAVQWLFDGLLRGGLLWEDVAAGAQSKAAQTLGWFAQHRSALPRGNRNLEDHRGLGALYRVLEPLLAIEDDDDEVTTPSGRQARRTVRAGMLEQSLVLCRDSDLIVAVPLTQQSAQWWGRGTRWCTAGKDNNMFDRYNEAAPLIVVVMPDLCREGDSGGGKLQLWIGPNDQVQFMDSADDVVELEFVDLHWSRLEPLMAWAMERADMEPWIPVERMRGRMGELCVARHGLVIEDIPLVHRTPAICRAAVANNARALEYVPHAVQDEAMCLDAIRDNSNTLVFVAPRLRTRELCLTALASTGLAICSVPERLVTRDFVLEAVRRGMGLRFVPGRWRDAEVCHAAVAARGHEIEHVPGRLQTSELCALAVAGYGRALNDVARPMRTPELCWAAVASDGLALEFVDTMDVTAELCRLAVEQNPKALEYVPQELRTPLLCTIAIQGNANMLGYVPTQLRTAELCRLAVAKAPMAIVSIPSDVLDVDMCTTALLGNINAMRYFGRLALPESVYKKAIEDNARAIEFIPEHLLTHDLCALAVSIKPALLAYVPKRLQTWTLCNSAVQSYPYALSYICNRDLRERIERERATMPAEVPETLPAKWRADIALGGLAECLSAYMAQSVHGLLGHEEAKPGTDCLHHC